MKYIFDIPTEHPSTKRLKPTQVWVTRVSFDGGYTRKLTIPDEGIIEVDIFNYKSDVCDSGGKVEVLFQNESGSRQDLIEIYPRGWNG